jgi:hypothetical protein
MNLRCDREVNKSSPVGNTNRPPDAGRRLFVSGAPGVELSDDDRHEKNRFGDETH